MSIPTKLRHDSKTKNYVETDKGCLVFGMSTSFTKPYDIHKTSEEIVKRYNDYPLLRAYVVTFAISTVCLTLALFLFSCTN